MPIEADKIKQVNLRSEYLQDILDKVPSRITTWSNTGLLIIFLLIACGLKFIKYPDIVITEGVVTSQDPPIEIYSRASGRISHILKNDQDTVYKGEWLMVLENTSNLYSILILDSLIHKVDTVDFWKYILSTNFPDIKNLGNLQTAYSQFLRSVAELKLYTDLHDFDYKSNINRNREMSVSALIEQLKGQLAIQTQECSLAENDYRRNLKLNRDSVIAKFELEQKEMAYLTAKSKVEDLKNSIIAAQLQRSQLNHDVVSLASENGNLSLTNRNNLVLNYTSLLYQLQEWIEKYVIQSATNGRLNYYETRSENQFISNETKICTVTSLSTQVYFALVKIPITNSGKVKIGQTCLIKLRGFPFAEFGLLKGTIESITSASRDGFYIAKAKLPTQLVTTRGISLKVNGQLFGDAEIVTRDYSLFEKLFNSLISKT